MLKFTAALNFRERVSCPISDLKSGYLIVIIFFPKGEGKGQIRQSTFYSLDALFTRYLVSAYFVESEDRKPQMPE